jgi:hypothetical protein
MAVSDSKLARRFAQRISKAFLQPQFRGKLVKAAAGYEHKALAPKICEYLNGFLKAEGAKSNRAQAQVDWEGRDRGLSDRERYYPIVGFWAFPDAAVLSPFTCAFEFDREPTRPGSAFKTALMKASVHVLSGAYDACVFVYVFRRGTGRPRYLHDKSRHTGKLIRRLQAAGLYVSLVSKQR